MAEFLSAKVQSDSKGCKSKDLFYLYGRQAEVTWQTRSKNVSPNRPQVACSVIGRGATDRRLISYDWQLMYVRRWYLDFHFNNTSCDRPAVAI